MADLSSNAPPNPIWLAVKKQKVWIASAILLLLVALVSLNQAEESFGFVVQSLMKTGPYLLLSIGIHTTRQWADFADFWGGADRRDGF